MTCSHVIRQRSINLSLRSQSSLQASFQFQQRPISHRMADTITPTDSSSGDKESGKESILDTRDLEKLASHPSTLSRRRTGQIADAIDPPGDVHLSDAESLASINAPPSEGEVERGSLRGLGPPTKVYAPFSVPVLTSLMPASVFGVLARLGLLALTGYDEHAIFPLAWVQAAGCFIMGFALGLKDQIGA